MIIKETLPRRIPKRSVNAAMRCALKAVLKSYQGRVHAVIPGRLCTNNITANFIPVCAAEESDEQYSTRVLQRLLTEHTSATVFDCVLQGQNILWLFKKVMMPSLKPA